MTRPGARSLISFMKKEAMLQGPVWGHLPRFLSERELRDGSLYPVRRNTCLEGSRSWWGPAP
jgi:hypothetical protein